MLQTKSQLENLSKDELIENFNNDKNTTFSGLNDRFKDFKATYKMVNSNLSISSCNELLLSDLLN